MQSLELVLGTARPDLCAAAKLSSDQEKERHVLQFVRPGCRTGTGPAARSRAPPIKTTIISVDDHLVEPPWLFEGRMPPALQDRAPRIVETDRRAPSSGSLTARCSPSSGSTPWSGGPTGTTSPSSRPASTTCARVASTSATGWGTWTSMACGRRCVFPLRSPASADGSTRRRPTRSSVIG